MKIVLNAEGALALKEVCNAASTDTTRSIMCGVLVEVEGGKAFATATDSHILAHRSLGTDEASSDDGSFIIDAAAVGKVKLPKYGTVTLTTDDATGWATLAAVDGSVTVRLIVGEFPRYRQLVPAADKMGEWNGAIGLSPALFLRAAKAIGAGGPRDLGVVLAAGAPTKPMVIRVPGASAEDYAVQMPIRRRPA